MSRSPYADVLAQMEAERKRREEEKVLGQNAKKERDKQNKDKRKRRWVYFGESDRWVEASQEGFDKAIEQGRPVYRSIRKPRHTPDIMIDPSMRYKP